MTTNAVISWFDGEIVMRRGMPRDRAPLERLVDDEGLAEIIQSLEHYSEYEPAGALITVAEALAMARELLWRRSGAVCDENAPDPDPTW